MTSSTELTNHYAKDDPIDRIQAQLREAAVDLDALTPGDLAGVDEFHLGGKLATMALLESLPLASESKHLDIGCGIGGAARTIAAKTGCTVTGIDLTPGFVAAAERLSEMVGLSAQTTFAVADANTIEFPDDHFDSATLLHVGMNIEDKAAMFIEVARVLRPGGSFHVYDIMRIDSGDIAFPMPWSATPSTSFVSEPKTYVDALVAAGFESTEPIDCMPIVAQALSSAKENPPAVNLSHLMGENWPQMFSNLTAALHARVLAPIEIVGRIR